MIRCVFCGTENDEIFTYCLNCGKPLEQSMQTFKAKAPASAPVENVKLVIVKSDGTDGSSFPLKAGENVLGRGPVDIDLGVDPRIASRHAVIDVGRDVAFIDGVDMTFGSFVRLREPRVLADRDRVRIGHAVLEYRTGLQRPQGGAADVETLGSSAAQTGNVFGRILRVGPNDTLLGGWILNKAETLVGRTQGDIVLGQDGFVSSRHAIFAVNGNECSIKDQNSTNGTFLMVRGRVAISNGDQILIGPHLLRFQRG